MEPPEAEADKFLRGETSSGPNRLGQEEHKIVLLYDHYRFVLVVTEPEDRESGDVLSEFFDRMDKAKDDPDDLMEDRCLEDIVELAISECKDTMYAFATSLQKPNDKTPSLEDHLYPATFYLRLLTLDGKLQAVEINDKSEFASQYQPTPLPADFAPQPVPFLTPSDEIEFIKDLYMNKVLKVSKEGEVCVFKSAYPSNEAQLQREINVLQQISEKWKPDCPNRPLVPRFLGLVTSRGQIMGMLEEFIDGKDLQEFEIEKASSTQRQKWKHQIEQSIGQLHENGIVWGDVKTANIMIDTADNAWLIDFGGSWTDGWIERDLAETIEGDLQGFSRVVEFLNSELPGTTVTCSNPSLSD